MGTESTTRESALLRALSQRLGAGEADILVLGDGSGTTVGLPCGWYALVYDPTTQSVTRHCGSSSGSNNYAELVTYACAIVCHHLGRHGPRRLTHRRGVLVASDSELTVRCGNGNYRAAANIQLWEAVGWLGKLGYDLKWVHVPRNSNPFHVEADREAKRMRKLQMGEA
jgi:hypothetical protein